MTDTCGEARIASKDVQRLTESPPHAPSSTESHWTISTAQDHAPLRHLLGALSLLRVKHMSW